MTRTFGIRILAQPAPARPNRVGRSARHWEQDVGRGQVVAVVGAVLVGVLVLVLAGCGCVVWADRGGPRWARAAAALTLGAGRAVRSYGRSRPRRVGGGGDGGGDGGGTDGGPDGG
ncbi:hypothetical protein [Kitasatospora sp. NPDC018619]|uniref:hypothetical protein n=1 Tax=unclassified Kitasatospora TaxID=2633591 RepID=UPI0037B80D0C